MISDLVNVLYDEKWGNKLDCPCFSLYRMMAILWRRIVLDPFRSEIHDIILNLFQNQRKRIGNTMMLCEAGIITKDNQEYILIK